MCRAIQNAKYMKVIIIVVCLELVHQNDHQTSLEYIRVEKCEEKNNNGKYDADILNPTTQTIQ